MKQTKPIISACIISYNQQDYIAAAIEGALSQELIVPYEIVISDDYSTDNTPQIIAEFAKKDPRIRVLKHAKNVGMLRNWLQSINACKGSYVALCEGDDFWTDNQKLAKQLAVLQNNPSFSSCFTDASLNAEKTVHLRFNSYLLENDVDLDQSQFSLTDLSKGNFIPTCTIMFRKEGDLNLPKEYFSSPYADWFVHIYNALAGDFVLIPEQTASYRLQNAGVFGQIPQLERDRYKLKCLALLYQGYSYNQSAQKLLKKSTQYAIELRATNFRGAGNIRKFLLLKIISKLYHLTGFATFARQAARV